MDIHCQENIFVSILQIFLGEMRFFLTVAMPSRIGKE